MQSEDSTKKNGKISIPIGLVVPIVTALIAMGGYLAMLNEAYPREKGAVLEQRTSALEKSVDNSNARFDKLELKMDNLIAQQNQILGALRVRGTDKLQSFTK
jgi:flagellar basal body-associated protein FliL